MKTSAKDTVFGILRLISGLAMTVVGIYSIFNGHAVVGTTSKIIGICAIVCGIVSIAARIKISSIIGMDAHMRSVDSILLILLGLLFMNTKILNSLGKIMFIVIGLVIVFNAAESLISALAGRKNNDGWFVPRIITSVLLLIAGIWVFSNAGQVFSDMAGIIVGIYFITHGIETVTDWVGRERYRRNFAYLDDEE